MKIKVKKIGTENVKFNIFKKIDSTNLYAKKLAEKGCKQGEVVVAYEQTNGKGRLGRTFLSQKGGVYFSVVLRPGFSADDALFTTVAAAVAAARAIEQISGKKCEIKWVNDIYIDNKKVCGILTEGVFLPQGDLKQIILGVGINLFEPKAGFPTNLPLAGSIFDNKKYFLFKKIKKQQIISLFLKNFFKFYENLEKKEYINEYQNRSFLTDKKITYKKENQVLKATVVGIDENARLIIENEGKKEFLSYGDIQIVGMGQKEI